MSASDRGKILWKIADLMEKNIEELAELETLDNGKPIFESRMLTSYVADVFRYFAGWATNLGKPSTIQQRLHLYVARTGRRGWRDIGLEFSLAAGELKLGPALACGNTVVLKPAEELR